MSDNRDGIEMATQMESLMKLLLEFRDNRDWAQFHSPKNLAISIAVEVGELLEHFQWTEEGDAVFEKEVSEEIADVFIYLLLLSNELGIDLLEAARKKVKDNESKYPVNKAKGTSMKYTELQE